MARPLLRKGRMLPEDEEKIQRCTAFIEQEIEAKDLTSSLYSAKILDLNDRSEIDSGEIRVGRVRRLLEMLIMRGPYAYHEFIKALKKEGYDQVVSKLETSGERGADSIATHTSAINDLKTRYDTLTGTNIKESTDKSLSQDRLRSIEYLLEQLCQRVSRLESREDDPDLDFLDKECSYLKEQLSLLKADTTVQIRDLMKENVEKEVKIADLTSKLEEKQKQLQDAEQRILELEDRIHELESHCNKYRKDIDQLKRYGGIQADKLQRQERKIEMQSDRLKKQEKKLNMQEETIRWMQQKNEEKIGEVTAKMAQMANVLEAVQSNLGHDRKIRVIGRNVSKQMGLGYCSKNKWK